MTQARRGHMYAKQKDIKQNRTQARKAYCKLEWDTTLNGIKSRKTCIKKHNYIKNRTITSPHEVKKNVRTN